MHLHLFFVKNTEGVGVTITVVVESRVDVCVSVVNVVPFPGFLELGETRDSDVGPVTIGGRGPVTVMIVVVVLR